MSIYALGDLHLSFDREVIPGQWEDVREYKPMNLFGQEWDKHYLKIYQNWQEIVSNEDVVLIPGDISWASDLEEVKGDLNFISHLPGKKVFIRGNHDYWWQGIKKVRALAPENFYFIQNDALEVEEAIITGSRGWLPPNENKFDDHDQKIFQRELGRLELSLQKLENKEAGKKIITMLHYMPVNEKHEKNELIELLIKYGVDICIYGHLHGKEAHNNCLEGQKWGINFRLVSADYLNFRPIKIL